MINQQNIKDQEAKNKTILTQKSLSFLLDLLGYKDDYLMKLPLINLIVIDQSV
jgi:hypothetical protein